MLTFGKKCSKNVSLGGWEQTRMTNVVFPSIDYRKYDQAYVIDVIKKAESCHLIAPSGVGKSNLLQMIPREDVRRHHFGNSWDAYLFVMLNPHKLIFLEPSALELTGRNWAGYELMLKGLLETVRPIQHLFASPDTVVTAEQRINVMDELEGNYGALLNGNRVGMQSAIRYLEDSVRVILTNQMATWRLVFVFDELEQFFNQKVLTPIFFQSLRGLRDDFKKQLMFITVSRNTLEELVEDLADDKERATAESFLELFNDFVWYVRPLDMDSAIEALNEMGRRYGKRLKPETRDQLVRVGGGHPGIMKRAYLTVAGITGALTDDQLAEVLAADSGVLRDCSSLLTSLPPAQRDLLARIARTPDHPYEPEKSVALTQLVLKGLVDRSRAADGRLVCRITMPVLAHVLGKQPK